MKPKQSTKVVVPNHTAELLYRMAEKFYKDPANVAAFEAWQAERAAMKEKGVMAT